jgi:hypothetical protein
MIDRAVVAEAAARAGRDLRGAGRRRGARLRVTIGVLGLISAAATDGVRIGLAERSGTDITYRQGPRPGRAPGPPLGLLAPHTTLVMFAHTILTVIAARERANHHDHLLIPPVSQRDPAPARPNWPSTPSIPSTTGSAGQDGDANTRHAPRPATTNAEATTAIDQHLQNEPGLSH